MSKEQTKTPADHIKAAYHLVSQLKVNGDAVDVVALARNELREAIKLLEVKVDGE